MSTKVLLIDHEGKPIFASTDRHKSPSKIKDELNIACQYRIVSVEQVSFGFLAPKGNTDKGTKFVRIEKER